MLPYPDWLNPGDNAWQLVAATLVGLMSIPGDEVLETGDLGVHDEEAYPDETLVTGRRVEPLVSTRAEAAPSQPAEPVDE